MTKKGLKSITGEIVPLRQKAIPRRADTLRPKSKACRVWLKTKISK